MTNNEQHFVTEACQFKHVVNDKYLAVKFGDKTRYAGGLLISGVNIFAYNGSDRLLCMISYGDAVLLSKGCSKNIFIARHPDYSKQIAWLGQHEQMQTNANFKNILARQRHVIEWWTDNRMERRSCIITYGDSMQAVDDELARYAGQLQRAGVSAEVCTTEDFITIYKALLQGGEEQYGSATDDKGQPS
ncbi:hypothetical protein Ethha_2473 [Ethanoligenens harbinense YUAN-3]|uniref:Uncharacterized protein n=1 Tax=Ethanoligenens harbinense (strain DSM 18485 / JCM 12961 / CGMCC 1.5033 / YUAN-3) TaxID=663278 RepID=E6U5V0_ETHHY|nr:hypothetical protein Ethha_2473 [Ethanoligenens harbinense YUAN-3]AVQ96995.1 hypothetical protein CXQ68_12700 [Ethanoligenens harbinense YUAN-3]AYF39655.1 hypothetical protein CXP51_12595 [Ethanoligenens harbinense]AYF42487.1 hypothetical protein CN246_13170 [Ethanoligenens harbinense]QCN93237.1 hypothetical protein DRA42_12745 [Ethanoligenens harbinense]